MPRYLTARFESLPRLGAWRSRLDAAVRSTLADHLSALPRCAHCAPLRHGVGLTYAGGSSKENAQTPGVGAGSSPERERRSCRDQARLSSCHGARQRPTVAATPSRMVRRYAPGEPLWVFSVSSARSAQHIDARLSSRPNNLLRVRTDQRLHLCGLDSPGPRDAGGLVVRCRNADVGSNRLPKR